MDFFHPFFKECLLHHTPSEIIQKIQQFVTDHKKMRIDQVLKTRISSIHIAMEAPSNIHNALATVRSAEAFGIYNMHVIAPENEDRKRRGRKTTQGAYRWVNVVNHKTQKDFKEALCKKEILLVGADVNGKIPLSQLTLTRPICLVFGNEEKRPIRADA